MLRLASTIVKNLHAPRYEMGRLRAWYARRRHFLLDGEYVALAEIVRQSDSFALVRSPTFIWFWLARAWVLLIKFAERKSDYVTTRIVTPDRADYLEAWYREWTQQGMDGGTPEKFSDRLRRWASHKR